VLGAMAVMVTLIGATSLVSGVLLSAAVTRAELTEDFGESLKFGALWDYFRRTWKDALLSSFVFGLLAVPLVLLGMMLCFVGMYFAIVLLQVAAMHLRWQIYEVYLARGGAPIPVKVHAPRVPAYPQHPQGYPQGYPQQPYGQQPPRPY
jgi:hypothetical protein